MISVVAPRPAAVVDTIVHPTNIYLVNFPNKRGHLESWRSWSQNSENLSCKANGFKWHKKWTVMNSVLCFPDLPC